MIRDSLCDQQYWDKWVVYGDDRTQHVIDRLKEPFANPAYRPQYVYQLAQKYWHQIFSRYSRGDAIRDLSRYFLPLLDSWEEAERLGKEVWTSEQQFTRHDWTVNLDHYIVCFWLVGLALALQIPDAQWERLLALVGNEGNDILLDRVIATRQPGRKIGNKLCHPKPYQRLLDAIDAPQEDQANKLQAFVKYWFKELDRPARKGVPKPYARPYWYTYGDQNIEGGAYFGRWCVEAVAVVKAFGLDDSLCLGHPHYPGDLLRPDGPTTHPERVDTLPKPEATQSTEPARKGLFARLFGS